MKVSDFMENNKSIEDLNGIIKGAYYISFPLSFIGFMIPIYAIDMGASSMEMAMIYTVFSVITIVIKPFVGKLIDLRGRKTGILIGGILYACALITLFLGKAYEFILASRILQSAAAAFMWISLDTMISDVSTSNERGKNFGGVQQILNKGELLGSFIGFNLYFNQIIENINYIFGIYALFVILGIYKAFKYGKETLNKNNNVRLERKINKNLLKEVFKKNFIIYLIFTFTICFLSSMTAPIFFVYIRDNILPSLYKKVPSPCIFPSNLSPTYFPPCTCLCLCSIIVSSSKKIII